MLSKSMIEPLTLSKTGSPLIFAHANGYPPESYRQFLKAFQDRYQITALYLRPLHPGSNPLDLKDWRLFRDDYLDYLDWYVEQSWSRPGPLVGIGHSLGGMTTLMAAMVRPEMFRCLILIEPVLLRRFRGGIVRYLARLGFLRRFFPLIRGTLKRKTHFSDRQAMFENYRSKPVFSGLSDQVLDDYVSGLAAQRPDGSVDLKYPPKWESRIYETAGTADRFVWDNLARVPCPVLVLRGERTDTLFSDVLDGMINGLPQGRGITVPEAGHLLPLEAPEKTSQLVEDFLSELE